MAASGKGSGGKGSSPRLRELSVPLFGAERSIGCLPTRLHSDMRHLVEMLRRGKQPRLAEDRVKALEQALAESGSESKTLAELRARVEEWRTESLRAFDADRYYDGARTSGYTEHNRGPQEALARRALQLSSLTTTTTAASAEARDAPRPGLLAIDLGCGSGLSTAVAAELPAHAMGVIGVDLSSEMLRAEAWTQTATMRLAGERLRCDLAQPLPLRSGIFDVAYSVAAVHYLAMDSQRDTADHRVGTLLSSLRRCLSDAARPCTLQAFLSREPAAVPLFERVAPLAGWALCDLVVDKTYGAKGAEREFLYLLTQVPPKEGAARPSRCMLYSHLGATCALALEAWARTRGSCPVCLDAAHHAWLEREHVRFAKRVVRVHGKTGTTEPAEALSAEAVEQLAALLQSNEPNAGAADDGANEEPRDAEFVQRILEVLHVQ